MKTSYRKKYVKLSKIPNQYNAEEVINYLIDKSAVGILNDKTLSPQTKYNILEIEDISETLKEKRFYDNKR